MAEIEMVGVPVRASKSPNSYISLALWGLFGLVVVAMVAAQVYVLAAGQTAGRGEAGRTPLSETGIAYVQDSLRAAANNPAFPVLAIAVALLLGGLHVMTPGHNKVLVGAYLVGVKARPRDAILIGVATALSHTLSVIVIGALALTVRGQNIATLYLQWLGLPSGLVVLGLGTYLLTRHLNDDGHAHDKIGDHSHDDGHSHTEDHTHAHGHAHDHSHHHHAIPTKLTLGGLIALGLVHGLVPTTDALAVLLVALTVKQVALGIGLILAYSLGIAVVMSSIGILFLKSLLFFGERFEKATRWLPAVAALLVMLFGLSILTRALITLL